MSVAARIPTMQSGLVRHEIAQAYLDQEREESQLAQQEPFAISPFEQLQPDNSVPVSPDEVTATDDYWNLDWWTTYLLGKISDTERNFYIDVNTDAVGEFIIFRNDGVRPQSGTRTNELENEWLLARSKLITKNNEQGWQLLTAWQPQRGLTVFLLDAPQYRRGELEADEAILKQAQTAASNFMKDLDAWLQAVTSSNAKAPVAFAPNPSLLPIDYKMEGMICQLLYSDPQENRIFIIYYNVAIMKVTGFVAA